MPWERPFAIAQGDMLEIRLLLMPISDLLIRVADLEESLFIEVFTDELHTDGHVVREPAGEG